MSVGSNGDEADHSVHRSQTDSIDGTRHDGGGAGSDEPGDDHSNWFRRWLWLIAPVGLALVVRVLYWAFVTPDWVPDSDADQYLRLARAVANGDGYSLVFPQLEMHATAFRPPLYPALLAIPSAVFGQEALWPARALSLLLSLAVVALTVVFVKRLFGTRPAVLAGCAVALMPSLIANDTVTLTEPLGLVILLAILIFLDQHRAVLTGVCVGALMLTRPNAYLVALVVAIFLWRWVGWKKALLCLACAVAVVVPWSVRNAIQLDTWRLTTSEGFNLAAIYAPPAMEEGTFVDPVFAQWYDDTEYQLLQFDEAAWNEALTTLAVDTIRENPTYVAEVVSNNVLSFFELRRANNEFAERIDGRNIDFRNATIPIFYGYLVLGSVGLVLVRSQRRIWPAYLIVGQFVFLSLLLVSPPRLRAPFDLLLCVGVGVSVDRIARFVADRRHGGDADTRAGDPVAVSEEDPVRAE